MVRIYRMIFIKLFCSLRLSRFVARKLLAEFISICMNIVYILLIYIHIQNAMYDYCSLYRQNPLVVDDD
jgi:hypothetical protein